MTHNDYETSAEAKARIAASIEDARADLERALAQLEQLSVIDPSTIGYVAHALNNYLTVSSITVEMLQAALRDHPNPEVRTWLDGIYHALDLMLHTIGTLMRISSPGDFPLKRETINLHVLMSRASHFFRRIANRKQIIIAYRPIGEIPLVRADRVAVAVVAENLLSNAIKFSSQARQFTCKSWQKRRMSCARSATRGQESVRRIRRGCSRKGRCCRQFQRAVNRRRFGLAVAKEFVDRMGGSLWWKASWDAALASRFGSLRRNDPPSTPIDPLASQARLVNAGVDAQAFAIITRAVRGVCDCRAQLLPRIRVLASSFALHHRNIRMTALLIDDEDRRVAGDDEPFRCWRLGDIGLDRDEIARLAGCYDILELSTAIKPRLLMRLIEESRKPVIYLDPDIKVFNTLEEAARLARDRSIVLTPHTIAPYPRDGRNVDELNILAAGVYNLRVHRSQPGAAGFSGLVVGAHPPRRVRGPEPHAVYRPAMGRFRPGDVRPRHPEGPWI
jgi:hypothetical protein